MKKKILSSVLATSVAFGVISVPSSFADTDNVPSKQNVEAQNSVSEDLKVKVDKYIKVNDNKQFVITNEKELKKIVTKQELDLVKANINKANKELSKMDSSALTVSEGNAIQVQDNKFSLGGGYNDVKFHWWGIEVYLSAKTASGILKMSVSGAAALISSLSSGIAWPVASAMAAAVINNYIEDCAIKITYKWGGPTVVTRQ